MVQREGRILRRGNNNKEIFIYRYIAEGSFDSYSWQILETKQSFISQFLSGSTYQKCITDLEQNVLTYAEVKALALVNPLMKEKAEKENELKNLLILNSKGNEAEQALQQEYKELGVKIALQQDRIEATKNNLEYIKSYDNVIKLKCNRFKQAFTQSFINSGNSNNIKSILDFRIYPPEKQSEKNPFLIVERMETQYILAVGEKTDGNAIRLKNFFRTFNKQLEKDESILEKLEDRKADIEKHEITTTYGDKIKRCKDELKEIESKLEMY